MIIFEHNSVTPKLGVISLVHVLCGNCAVFLGFCVPHRQIARSRTYYRIYLNQKELIHPYLLRRTDTYQNSNPLLFLLDSTRKSQQNG